MRYAICNETFDGWDHERVCKTAAALGYGGLELAPFTFAPLITDVSAEQRKQIRGAAEDAGIQIIGLHWLLAKTEGFQVTAQNPGVREQTANYLGELARFCRDVGGDVMVFGSPKQRLIPKGASWQQAFSYAADTFRMAAPKFAEYGVKLALEPLAPNDAEFLNTCDEACRLLDAINHPNFVLHQDVKAMASEGPPIPDLIRAFASRTGHFHANDPNMRGPGFGDYDFVPVFKALKDTGYSGWVSVEVFDYRPDPETIGRESLRYMRECEAKA